MSPRLHNWVWLLLAVVMAIQSLGPAVALADVTMRCVGASLSAAPCARTVVSVTDMTRDSVSMAAMSCCQRMGAQCPMVRHQVKIMGARASTPSPRASLSMPSCLISVSVVGFSSTPSRIPMHRWMLEAAPALAPPAREISLVPAAHSVSRRIARSSLFPEHLLRAAHGLRAPPVA